MTAAQKLRRLQWAVDHVALVLEDSPEAEAELSQALDLIHHAEFEIQDAAS